MYCLLRLRLRDIQLTSGFGGKNGNSIREQYIFIAYRLDLYDYSHLLWAYPLIESSIGFNRLSLRAISKLSDVERARYDSDENDTIGRIKSDFCGGLSNIRACAHTLGCEGDSDGQRCLVADIVEKKTQIVAAIDLQAARFRQILRVAKTRNNTARNRTIARLNVQVRRFFEGKKNSLLALPNTIAVSYACWQEQ